AHPRIAPPLRPHGGSVRGRTRLGHLPQGGSLVRQALRPRETFQQGDRENQFAGRVRERPRGIPGVAAAIHRRRRRTTPPLPTASDGGQFHAGGGRAPAKATQGHTRPQGPHRRLV
ncbi:uncharacterized protein METZ01_LOCUS274700, partial [marine metagenome]